jgi:hypothetical protein
MESLDSTKNGNFDFDKELAIQRITEELRKADKDIVIELSDEFINASLCDSDKIISSCIKGIRVKTFLTCDSEQREQEKLEERDRVNSLSENEKLKYAIEKLRRIFCGIVPSWQREVIQLLTKGCSGNENHKYYLDKIEELFSGFDNSFRSKVFFVYLTNILPPLEAEYAKEKEIEDLTNEYLNLCNSKSAEQLRAMIQTIKQSRLVEEAA